ncbi:hypothetical protein KI387_039737, partial [Taxus chinensis]
MDDEFSAEFGNLELTFEGLQTRKQVSSCILIKEGIIQHGEKHFQLTKAIRFKINILNEACSKLRESIDQLVDGTNDIEEELVKIYAKVLNESS